jgi:hypothetical protein
MEGNGWGMCYAPTRQAKEWPALLLRTLKELHRFMGLTGYYREFIRHPLTDRIAQERGAISVDVWRRHGILHPARLCTTHCGGDRFLSDWRWYGSNAAQSPGILPKQIFVWQESSTIHLREGMHGRFSLLWTSNAHICNTRSSRFDLIIRVYSTWMNNNSLQEFNTRLPWD